MAKQVSPIVEFMDQILPTVQAFYQDRMYHLNGRKGLRPNTIRAVVEKNLERQVFDIYFVSPKPGTQGNEFIYEQFYIRADALYYAIQNRRQGQNEFDLEKYRIPFVAIQPNPEYKIDWAGFEVVEALKRRIINRVTKHYKKLLDDRTTEYAGQDTNIAIRLRFDAETSLVRAEEIRTEGDPADITDSIDFSETLLPLKAEYSDQQWAEAISDIVPMFNRAFIWSQVCFAPPTSEDHERIQAVHSEAVARLASKIVSDIQTAWETAQEDLYETFFDATNPTRDILVRLVLDDKPQLRVQHLDDAVSAEGLTQAIEPAKDDVGLTELYGLMDRTARGMRQDLWVPALEIIRAEWDQHFPAVNLKDDSVVTRDDEPAADDTFALDA